MKNQRTKTSKTMKRENKLLKSGMKKETLLLTLPRQTAEYVGCIISITDTSSFKQEAMNNGPKDPFDRSEPPLCLEINLRWVDRQYK